MSLMRDLRRLLRRFSADETGSTPVEGVLSVVVLAWWLAVSFQFTEAFRTRATNVKASYTIADAISRERAPVNDAYIDGLKKLFDYITQSKYDSWIRVSSIYWDAQQNQFRVDWSHATGTIPAQTDASIAKEADRIPAMPVGDTALVVETAMRFDPIFGIGIGSGWHNNFVVTRPRGFRVVWEN